VIWGDENLTDMTENELEKIRGKRSRDDFPRRADRLVKIRRCTVGQQAGSAYAKTSGAKRLSGLGSGTELLRKVRIPEPERRMDEYPINFRAVWLNVWHRSGALLQPLSSNRYEQRQR
jgi:ABC-type microcin C transport system duplicated ATPase subunit YejF